VTAARLLVRKGLTPPGDVIIQSVIDEEPSGNGTLALMQGLLRRGIRLAIVMEPTRLNVLYGHRGLFWFRLAVRGKAAHAATGRGLSAIRMAAHAVGELEDLNGATFGAMGGKRYPAPRLNVGVIKGGTNVYTVPGECVVEFSVRYAPGERREVLDVVEDRVRRLRGLSDFRGGRVTLGLRGHSEAAETAPGSGSVQAFLSAVRAVRPRARLGTMAATCDARHFANRLGVPVVIFGPGDIACAHAGDEYVDVSEVMDSVAILTKYMLLAH
jgi:acetylornithine deacetylase/succinyl-diaminopimelate desuccinylase-like protein